MISIQLAQSDEDIARCFSAASELRPHLVEADFLARVRSMQRGFELAFLEAQDAVKAVAGFRGLDFSTGRSYVDDLVTTASARSQGLGDALFDWLLGAARERGCVQLELGSDVQRFEAHRFYPRRRMKIRGHHFVLPIEPANKSAAQPEVVRRLDLNQI